MGRIRSKLTYANVMSSIAVFLVLGGGAAVAAEQLGKNTVGTKQLKRGAVTSAKVKDGTLKAQDFGKLAFGPRLGAPGPAGPRGAVGPEGPRGPVGPEGPRGPSDGYQAHGAANPVSASAFGTQVVNLAVPPGSYFAVSTVEAETADPVAGVIRCQLTDGGPGSTPTTRTQTVPLGDIENMTLASHFEVGAGEGLSLNCSREGASEQMRVVEANIVAVQIAEFSGVGD